MRFTGTASDPDGTIARYEWDFGDGTSAPLQVRARPTGRRHLPGEADGDRQRRCHQTLTNHVPVTAPTQIAADEFDRTVTNAWGTAERGGAWTTSGTASNFAVDGGRRHHEADHGIRPERVPERGVGPGRATWLPLSATTRQAPAVACTPHSSPAGAAPRTTRAVVRVTATAVTVELRRTMGGTATILATPPTVPGGALGPLIVRSTSSSGLSESTPPPCRPMCGAPGSSEPTAWTVTTARYHRGPAGPRCGGVYSYLSGSATNAPVMARFDRWGRPGLSRRRNPRPESTGPGPRCVCDAAWFPFMDQARRHGVGDCAV